MDHHRSARLKRRALIIGGLGIALSVIIGLIYIGLRDDATASWAQIMFCGLLIIILGAALSWLVSLCVYGYGIMVEERKQTGSRRRGRKEEPARVSRVYMPNEM